MVTYRATQDVPRALVQYVARLLRTERVRIGTRKLSCFTQAVLGLRWLRDRTDPTALGRDHGVSRATAYRYRDEVLRVLATQAPTLPDALATAHQAATPHVILDGKIFRTDRYHGETTLNRHNKLIDVWYSGKARVHGGLITMVTTPGGFPIWVSPVEPGRTHDLAATLNWPEISRWNVQDAGTTTVKFARRRGCFCPTVTGPAQATAQRARHQAGP